MAHDLISSVLFVTSLPIAALRLAAIRLSETYKPFEVLDLLMLLEPCTEVGPVLAPPCNLHRLDVLRAGRLQGVPLRVLAPQV